jgi:ATP-dependent helicase/nuclease subunit A
VVRREREETKRLLYVAVTRARDRLYLGSALKDGRIQPGRGSLAEVLPASLLARLTPSERVEWRASSGTVHRLHVCVPDACPGAEDPHRRRLDASPDAGDADRQSRVAASDFAPVTDALPMRSTVADALARHFTPDVLAPHGRQSDRLLGTLVHRLFQRLGPGADVETTRTYARQLVGGYLFSIAPPEEGEELVLEPESTVDASVAVYGALSRHPDLRRWYACGQVIHEVPFTLEVDGAWLRGTIDCLVRDESGRVTVLDFKTGRPRPEHQAQIELYRRAAACMFPGDRVEAHLVYPDDTGLAAAAGQTS